MRSWPQSEAPEYQFVTEISPKTAQLDAVSSCRDLFGAVARSGKSRGDVFDIAGLRRQPAAQAVGVFHRRLGRPGWQPEKPPQPIKPGVNSTRFGCIGEIDGSAACGNNSYPKQDRCQDRRPRQGRNWIIRRWVSALDNTRILYLTARYSRGGRSGGREDLTGNDRRRCIEIVGWTSGSCFDDYPAVPREIDLHPSMRVFAPDNQMLAFVI